MIRLNILDTSKSKINVILSDVYNGNGILCDEKGNIYDGEFVLKIIFI